jgi:ketosteroid isomerase-like protein
LDEQQYQRDYIAISQVKARYCRFLDTKDWAAYADLFTDDFELDTFPSGEPVIRGRAEAMASIRSFIEHAQTAHHVHSPEMQIEGDVAQVTWAMQDRVVGAALPERGHLGFGHYHERYVRQGGRWRIAALKLRYLFVERDPLD